MLIPNKHSGYQAGIRIYPGGGKGGGSSAPPPDPRLIQAQIDSMGYQNRAIQQLMDNQSQMVPLQKQQLQFGLDTARTAWDQSQADRTYALGRRDKLTGLQDQVIGQAKGFNEEGRTQELNNQAQADLQSGYSNAMQQNARGMARMGGNPYGASYASMANSMALGQSLNSANASAMAARAAKAEGIQLTDRAANMLAGYPAMGMQATGAGAGYGGMGVGYANSTTGAINSGWGGASSAAGGMGSNAAGMYGAMGSYKNGQDQIAASNDPFNTILGAAAGGAGAYGMSKALKAWG